MPTEKPKKKDSDSKESGTLKPNQTQSSSGGPGGDPQTGVGIKPK